MTAETRSRSLLVSGGAVVALGGALGLSHVRHLVLMDSLLGKVVQALIPLALSIGIVYLGASVARGRLVSERDARRLLGWVTVGVSLLLLTAAWLLFHGFMVGHPPMHAFAVAMNAATVGALLGLAVGTYDAQRRRSQRALVRQNERLDQFASIVAHDIRNPLGVAMGRVEMAREERGSEHLDVTANSLDRMDRLVDDVLALARNGGEVVDPEEFALESVVLAAWQSAGAETATLRVADDLGRVRGDPGRVQQLFENLFRNAVEHGGADVSVRVGLTGDGFYVEDDGPGIPEGEREQVFEYGYTTAVSTGFGLAIVETVAEGHGWSVALAAGADGGARFEFGGVDRAKGRSPAPAEPA